MKREIKFRAWDTKNNKYIGIVDLSVSRTFWDYPLGDSDNYCLEQFIGIKDKNGKEIYEGDILKNHTGIVFTIHSIMDLYFSDRHPIQGNNEIIGNIYQNPEPIN